MAKESACFSRKAEAERAPAWAVVAADWASAAETEEGFWWKFAAVRRADWDCCHVGGVGVVWGCGDVGAVTSGGVDEGCGVVTLFDAELFMREKRDWRSERVLMPAPVGEGEVVF